MLQTKSNRQYQFIINIVLILVTAIMVLPFILLFLSSITAESALVVHGYSFFPKEFSLSAYQYIMQNATAIFRAYGITILVTIIGTIAGTIGMSMLAYVISVQNLPGRKGLMFYIFFSMLFNGGLVPTYIMWTQTFGIKNTLWALLLPNLLMTPMNVILMRSYYQNNIPSALYEAAQIDGASQFRVYRSVVVPLGKPIFVTVGLFTGLSYWNDWTNALYYINDKKLYSLQALLNQMLKDAQALAADFSGDAGAVSIPTNAVRMAIAFVAILPILIIYPFLQKYFQKGIALGAVKG